MVEVVVAGDDEEQKTSKGKKNGIIRKFTKVAKELHRKCNKTTRSSEILLQQNGLHVKVNFKKLYSNLSLSDEVADEVAGDPGCDIVEEL